MELRIDPEFAGSIPPVSDEEFVRFEENILADGVIIIPIIVWDGVIIGGHNRFRIAGKHPHISFTTCGHGFNDRHEAMAWICRNQLGRRNLTFQQRKYLIGKQYGSEKLSHGGDRKSIKAKPSFQVENLISHEKTCERIANENGISRNSVIRAETFSKAVDMADGIDPGIRSDILTGRIRLTQKEIQALVKASPEERAAIVGCLRMPQEKKEA